MPRGQRPRTVCGMAVASTTLPHETVWAITTAAVPARALQLAADLGVADQIEDESVTVDELASRCGVAVGALDRMLRLLVAHGIFEHRDDGYRHTEPSRLLRSDDPRSMRAFARMFGLPLFWDSFGGLAHSLHTLAPAVELVERNGFWSYLQGHPEEARIFDEAMTAKARGDVAAVVDAYDFGPFRTIADIGGGRGHLLRAVIDAAPGSRGVLFDLPDVVDALGFDETRITRHAGDFFVDPLPRADAYVLMEVIHDWADPEAMAILRAIRRAASPGAMVLIVEGVVPESGDDARVHTLDLVMLAITGGRERTARQLGALLHGAEFRVSAVLETAGPMRIVEAVAV